MKPVTIEFIKLVAKGLGDLNKEAVFIGGASVPFYLPPEMQAASRPTEDIDIVLEIIQTRNRHEIEEDLRKKGFQHDTTEGAPICRWKFKDFVVDIMTPDEKVFGFTNKWYSEGIKHAETKDLEVINVRILTLPYFLGTKIEAFKGRGENDFMGSPDMEDIITILDGLKNETFKSIFRVIGQDLSIYLSDEFKALLNNQEFLSAVPGAVFDRVNARERTANVLSITQKIIDFINSDRAFEIIVNGEKKTWPDKEISYDQIVRLAFPSPPQGIVITCTVEYERGDDKKSEGSMISGQSVKLKDGMIFSVTETGRS